MPDLSSVRDSDLGAYYTCIARNGEGRIEHVYQLVEAGQLMLNLLLNPYRRVRKNWRTLFAKIGISKYHLRPLFKLQ